MLPQATYYSTPVYCNITSATSHTTISSVGFYLNYYMVAFGTANPYPYAVWNLGVTPTVSGIYLIGLNYDNGIQLTFNGVVYFNTLFVSSGTVGPNLLYGMAGSVSLIAGQTYPINVQYCSGSTGATAVHTIQLLWTPPDLTTQLMPVFNGTFPVVPTLVTFAAFASAPQNITTTSTTQKVVNTIEAAQSNVNAQTTCPSTPFTRINGSCIGCPVYTWFTAGSYTFVPAGFCSQAYVQLWGAAGQDGTMDYEPSAFCGQYGQRGIGYGGYGGYTEAVVNLVPGSSYTVVVGSGGTGHGTYGGGAQAHAASGCGLGIAAGGGLSGLYDSGNNPWLIAGGGGGGGSSANGGAGGGLAGLNSSGLYYGTGASTITDTNGVNTYNYATSGYPQCIGAGFGAFIYSGGGGGLYQGGSGGESACYAATTINTTLLSFAGAGGGSGYMCGQGGSVLYGITVTGNDPTIDRAPPYFPGSGYPNQLLDTFGNDGGAQITCLIANGTTTTTNTTTYTPPPPQQTFGSPTTLTNTCPPYTVANTSNPVCQPVLPLPLPPNYVIPTVVCPSNRTFYVDQLGGNDANSGSSPGSAWATLNQVGTLISQLFFNPGDTILFCRGDVYMRQSADIDTPTQNINAILYPNCSVRFSSYVCNESTANVLPFFTVSSILPQTSTVGWETVPWPLLNGSTISVLMYNFTLLESLSNAYLPGLSSRSGGVNGVWVNSFPYQLARHPNVVDLSIWDYNHQLGTTLYEWMHTDPNDYINHWSNGDYSDDCYTPPNTNIAPGSWCNHIWYDMFAQNTTYMHQVLQNASFFTGVYVFANAIQGYANINYQFTNGGYYLNASNAIDCEVWYNMTIAPYFPSNFTWPNPVFDGIPMPPPATTVGRAYMTGFASNSPECDPGRAGHFPPPGIPASVTNFSFLYPATDGNFFNERYPPTYAYNNAFILSNHYAFLDNPGEYYYDTTTDCLYIVPYSARHTQILTQTYNTFTVAQSTQLLREGISTSFNLAFVAWHSLDVQPTVFTYNTGYAYHVAQIVEIDSLEFGFGSTAMTTGHSFMVFHHNILRGMTQGVIAYYNGGIVANNIIHNTTSGGSGCITVDGPIALVFNNTCAYTTSPFAVNSNGAQLEIVRGNVVVNPGLAGLSLAGGNTYSTDPGVVQSTVGEFNWVDQAGQLGAQWAAVNSEEGIFRYNEITNMHSGNYVYLHFETLSQLEGISTIQNNMIVDNNILVNGSGGAIYEFNSPGSGFAVITNNLFIDAMFEGQTDGTQSFSFANNQLIMTNNYLPNIPSPVPYMLPPQVNVQGFGAPGTPSFQTSVCHGLVDDFSAINGEVGGYPALSQFWNGYASGNIPPLVLSNLYTEINYQPTEYYTINVNNIQAYLAGVYTWVHQNDIYQPMLPLSQMAFGAENCSYFVEQQLALKRVQNCQARINSEPAISVLIYNLYPNYHTPTGCWPPVGDRVI